MPDQGSGELEESLEERLKAEGTFPKEVIEAADAYFLIEKDPEKALQKLADLGPDMIDQERKKKYLTALKAAKRLTVDPAGRAREIAKVYEEIRDVIAFFIGPKITKLGDELSTVEKWKINTNRGASFLLNYQNPFDTPTQEKIKRSRRLYEKQPSAGEVLKKLANKVLEEAGKKPMENYEKPSQKKDQNAK